jgi:hypothetical protein
VLSPAFEILPRRFDLEDFFFASGVQAVIVFVEVDAESAVAVVAFGVIVALLDSIHHSAGGSFRCLFMA